MKALFITMLFFMAAAASAGDFSNFNIQIKQNGYDLVVTAAGKGKAPSLSKAVGI